MTEVAEDTRVLGLDWDEFLEWLAQNWEPGQHMALVGPTGEGKTTFAVGILKLRKFVIALDPKGEDDTLSASGFIRIPSLPLPRKIRNQVAEGIPTRIIIGGSSHDEREQLFLRQQMAKAIEMVRGQGGWTLFADEFQILADLRMYGLGKKIEELLISARRAKSSIVTAYQAPAWVPRAATRQSWGVAVFPTRDRGMIKNVAESMGRDWRMLAEVIDQLPQYFLVFIPKSIHMPMFIIHPPKVI